jgi:hypothetical protein
MDREQTSEQEPNKDQLRILTLIAKFGLREAGEKIGWTKSKCYELTTRYRITFDKIKEKHNKTIEKEIPLEQQIIYSDPRDANLLQNQSGKIIVTSKEKIALVKAYQEKTADMFELNLIFDQTSFFSTPKVKIDNQNITHSEELFAIEEITKPKPTYKEPEIKVVIPPKKYPKTEPEVKSKLNKENNGAIGMVVATIAANSLQEKLEQLKYLSYSDKPVKPLHSEHKIISSNAIPKSKTGMCAMHPLRALPCRQINIRQNIVGLGEEWTIIGWLDGRDCGNGCLNISVCRPEYFQKLRNQWEKDRLDAKEYRFEPVGPEYYTLSPGETGILNHYGQKIIEIKSNLVIGYHLVPIGAISQSYYYFVQRPYD